MVESPASDVMVKLDDRVRLLSALLAATRFPEMEWERSPHGSHIHARNTRRHVSSLSGHPAALTLGTFLDQHIPLETLFSLILSMNFPDMTLKHAPRWMPSSFPAQLHDFYIQADLETFWANEPDWQVSLTDCRRILRDSHLKTFFQPFLGEISANLIFIPNILYPTDQDITFRLGDDLVVIVPPRVAWGESPPWQFGDDPMHVYRAAIIGYGRILMMEYLRDHADVLVEVSTTPLSLNQGLLEQFPTWNDQFTGVFTAAAVAMYLEETISPKEANAFMLMERKVRGMDILPAAVSVFRRYRNDLNSPTGKYKDLSELLPVFPKQLKVASRIKAL